MSSSAVTAASRHFSRRSCNPPKICHVKSCAAANRTVTSLGRSRRYPNTCSTSTRHFPAQAPQQHRRGPFRAQTQRRDESTDKRADATKAPCTNTASPETAEQLSTNEAIRQTREAIQKLRKTRGTNRAQAIEEAFEAAKRQAETEPAMNWAQWRTPILFGAGLYLGLVLFGNHREEKKGSKFLAELKTSFDGHGSKREEGGGNGGNGGNVGKGSSEYEKWRANRADKEE